MAIYQQLQVLLAKSSDLRVVARGRKPAASQIHLSGGSGSADSQFPGPGAAHVTHELFKLLSLGRRLTPPSRVSTLEAHHPYLECGMGRAANNMRHGFAIQRAQRIERVTRALSIAIPVFAYICR